MDAKFNSLRTICEQAVDDGVVPGLVVAVSAGGRSVFSDAFGARQTEPVREPATQDTIYDLASLTKALATSVLAMKAVERGIWSLDDRLAAHGALLERSVHAAVTVRQVLAHAAGFAAHRPFYEQVTGSEGRSQIPALSAAEPPLCAPGTRSLYSDLGFILLGEALERRLGDRLDALVEREIVQPLGISALGYAGPWLRGRPVAPTELCPFRRRLIEGEVHDLNAAAMEGVAGHAGLFGSTTGVGTVVDALLAAWRGAAAGSGAPFVAKEVLREFWSPAGIPGSTWRLGWDGPAATGSMAGTRLDRRAVGHLAFTGCSLWIDPEREVWILVLCNRVHPHVRDTARFRALRPALNDAALEGLAYKT